LISTKKIFFNETKNGKVNFYVKLTRIFLFSPQPKGSQEQSPGSELTATSTKHFHKYSSSLRNFKEKVFIIQTSLSVSLWRIDGKIRQRKKKVKDSLK